MDKGYKPNTVFYGICADNYGNRIVVKYGLKDRKKKNISIGETIKINPLESDAYNKNKILLKTY
ncbi:MAG: hypothetical protein LBS55_13750 [Prevotellaceae bacterium]|jgi:hypothetical protein|nr:hypothetical protein [Prevotellaceae bacterium]